MIDRATATATARQEIARLDPPEQDEWILLEEATIERPFGWVFFYTARRYHETKDRRHAVAGNAPIIVDRRDGAVHHTGTGRPIRHFIEQYEQTGRIER